MIMVSSLVSPVSPCVLRPCSQSLLTTDYSLSSQDKNDPNLTFISSSSAGELQHQPQQQQKEEEEEEGKLERCNWRETGSPRHHTDPELYTRPATLLDTAGHSRQYSTHHYHYQSSPGIFSLSLALLTTLSLKIV